EPRSCRSCASSDLHQDPDILDTWFSSALWPFSTLGWPEETEDLRTFFPTSVLVTGYEIIHLWVARMIMTGLHFMGDVPFRWVYVHGIVRDELGRKMSKSLGNVIDPLKVIEGYGCDALRFTLAEHATGQDIFLNEQWITGGRNFANKLWNVARFVLMSLGEEAPAPELPPPERRSLADRWVLSRLARTASEVTSGLEGFEIAQAARALHSFLWSEYADWYIEAAKLRVAGEDEAAKTSSRAALAWIFDHILRLLHPFMPFITEEIYRLLPGPRGPSIMQSPWPAIPEELLDPTAEEAFGRVQEAVSALRSFRADHRVDPKVRLSVAMDAADPSLLAPLQEERRTVMALARLAELRVTGAEEVDPPVVRLAGGGVDLIVSLRGVLDDLEAE
ncbi:MAG: class I tRNA ligase family protein, partial [Candidatus Methylomirabilales bacterium]